MFSTILFSLCMTRHCGKDLLLLLLWRLWAALKILLVKINCYILTWRRVTESAKTSYLQAKRKLTLLNDSTARTECGNKNVASLQAIYSPTKSGNFNKRVVEILFNI